MSADGTKIFRSQPVPAHEPATTMVVEVYATPSPDLHEPTDWYVGLQLERDRWTIGPGTAREIGQALIDAAVGVEQLRLQGEAGRPGRIQ